MSLIIILSLVLLGIHSPLQQDIGTIAEHYKLGQEDYAVFSAVIDDLYISKDVKLAVIINETQEGQILKPSFHLKSNYVLITKKEADDLCIKCADTKFYEMYLNSPGYIKLSDISFNSHLNRASLVIERYCGNMCAEGIYVTLIKREGIWIVQQKEWSWQE